MDNIYAVFELWSRVKTITSGISFPNGQNTCLKYSAEKDPRIRNGHAMAVRYERDHGGARIASAMVAIASNVFERDIGCCLSIGLNNGQGLIMNLHGCARQGCSFN
jgi:hypothetical protein